MIFKSIPEIRTNSREKYVKSVNTKINPTMIPKGRRLLPVKDPDKMIGNIGKMQGEIMSAKPSKNPKVISSKGVDILKSFYSERCCEKGLKIKIRFLNLTVARPQLSDELAV